MRGAVRGHWPFALVLSAGLALRVLTEVAYRPALLYIDSAKYLVGSRGTAPEGYQVLLRLLDPVGGLALVAAVQHAFGLAMAIAVYALLIRRQVPRWAATLAAVPVLLDGYQLQLEQTVMPDVLFETMIAAGLVLLLWPRPPGQNGQNGQQSLGPVAAGVLVLGATTTVREIGGVLILPAVVFAVATASGWPRRTGRAALATASFALPILGYMAAAYFVTGHFGLASNGPAPEYGRAAAAADCATLTLPADERALCSSPARTLALGGIDGLLHNPQSPGHTVPVSPGTTRARLLAGFSLAVFRQQPLRVAASVARDSIRLFALTRDGDPEITNITRWQFQTFYPTYPHRYTMAAFTRLARQHGSGGDLVAAKPAATVLRDYQLGGGYTPGPLYAIGLVAGLLGSLCGLARRRMLVAERRMLTAAGSELAAACLLVTLSATVLLLSSDAYEFSWRYQLPAVVMLPVAGALGLTALADRIKRARASTAARTAVQTSTGGTGRRTRPASAASGPQAPADR
ncbi:MAG TPA: hypothetical protein VG123_26315 [Streptosporangiaceae bacterium]|nr:hypothetical protein [Streptosporangiaceae bacterium]